MPEFISTNFTPATVTAFIACSGALFWLSYHHPKSYNNFIYPIASLLLTLGMFVEIVLWFGYVRAFHELRPLLGSDQDSAADSLRAVFAAENNGRYYFEMIALLVLSVIRNLERIGVVKPLPGPAKED